MVRMHVFFLMVCVAVLTNCGGNSENDGNTNPGDPPPTVGLSGRVTYKGAALAGATVTNFLTNSNVVYKTATTDANGNYSFSGMSTGGDVPGEYQIYVNKAGYGFYPSVGGGGAKVMRSDYTGQYAAPGTVPPSGLFFTVIDFVVSSGNSVAGANFAAYDGSNPLVALPATGQKTSYAAGDDASLSKGVSWSAATRFTDNQDGTVTDSLTGLVWFKDAGCLGTASWANALAAVNALAGGQCQLTDGSAAGSWRLPNLNELESLIDVSAANPALPAGSPFVNVSGAIYWTSTGYYGGDTGSSAAWTIRLSDGRYMNDTSANVKATSSNQVWAVRGPGTNAAIQLPATGFYIPYAAGDDGTVQSGVRLTSPRFIENHDGTLTDTMTGLVWLKQANCLSGTWAEALTAVHSLASGQCGLADNSQAGQWRMPNRNELQSLSDRAQTNLAQYFDYTYYNRDGSVFQSPIFTTYVETQYYWTSTTDAADSTEAWTVYSCDFGVYDQPKTNVGYTLAVR
ncbi:MAG TPA: DUF1566 domain-containing protein [Verrucomicrobiae bacterium]|nr:DUF1566 domain-containing protein [Verrucomicrobiae bacterium]